MIMNSFILMLTARFDRNNNDFVLSMNMIKYHTDGGN